MTRHAEMLAELEQACQARGLLYVIMPPMQRARGCAGLPDALVIGLGCVLVIEAKAGLGETTPAQDLWAWALQNAEIEYFLWREGAAIGEVLDRFGPVPGAKVLYRT